LTGILRNLLFQSSSGTVGVHMNLSLHVSTISFMA
jgi:hypothetical protein